MEGARGVDDERRPHTVAEGRRQGYRSDRLPFPAAPRPARRLTARAGPARDNRKRQWERSFVREATKGRDRPFSAAQPPRRELLFRPPSRSFLGALDAAAGGS